MLALGVSGALGLTAVNAATYRIIDKGDVDNLKFTYAQQFNNSGEMAVSGTNYYNFPVQYEYLDEDDFQAIELAAERLHESVFGINDLEDYDAMVAGDPTANDLYWVVKYLQDKGTSPTYQKVGNASAMVNLSGQTESVTIFDKPFEETGDLTLSTTDYINGITHVGWIFGNGSAPYLPKSFVNSTETEITYFHRDFTTRGYFSPDGGTTIIEVLPPTEQTDNPDRHYGGESALLGMSDSSNYAVGYASVGLDEDKVEFIEKTDEGGCNDPVVLADLPLEVCIQGQLDGMYDLDAALWTISGNNEISVESLGILVEPHIDDPRTYSSVAQAVNDHGVAVGYSHGWVNEQETNPEWNEPRSLYGVIFKDGKVTSFTEDHEEYFESRTYDINNDGIAVGHATTYVNGAARTKAFWVDTNEENPKMVLPESYFKGAAHTARSVNNYGFFVGEGEVETHNDSAQNPRRTEGYIYDINNELVHNLNDLTACGSPYTITEARDINDNNVIAATAVVKADRRDAKGEVMLDENGNVLREDVLRAVILEPIDGEIEECTEEEDFVERQGAGFGFYALLSLFGFGILRRKLTNN